MSQPRRSRQDPRTSVGDPAVDEALKQVMGSLGPIDHADLIREMLVTVAKVARDGNDRGDLKLLNGAVRELRTSFRRFQLEADRPKVSIFGSARVAVNDPEYALATDLGRAFAAAGWMVITGGGPGIMTAAIEGAGGRNSFAVTIRLPFEPSGASSLVDDDHLVRFRYFFTRKLTFMKESSAYVILPGGFGTMDELFELLCLMQTGKEMPGPVVLVERPGGTYWSTWLDFVRSELVELGMIRHDDLELAVVVDTAEAAVQHIVDFYIGYHSLRFVEGRMVIRLQQEISDEALAILNTEFADIVASGEITRTEPLPAEIADEDHVERPRLALHFDNRSFARLNRLCRRLGDFMPSRTAQIHSPDRQGETIR
jgi:uncharacterized protein (TIGR00730 family)